MPNGRSRDKQTREATEKRLARSIRSFMIRSWRPFAILSLFLIIAALYIFALSAWQAGRSSFYSASDLYRLRGIDVLIVLWLLWIGSSIGSFLNVVVWRMPRGESLNGRSHCPRCNTRLKARDNFPVFGWLVLQGRCRTCHLPISPRYPIVESIVGVSLTIVGVCELYRLSLPFQTFHGHAGTFWRPTVDANIIGTLIYHCLALAFLWAMSLIRMDGNTIPKSLSLTALFTLAAMAIAFPSLMVVPWQLDYASSFDEAEFYVNAVMRVLTAIVAAAVFGRSLARGLCPGADPKLDPLGKSTSRLIDLIALIAVVAIPIGWQALPAILLVAGLFTYPLKLILPSSTDRLGQFSIALPIALLLQIVFWRHLHAATYWPSFGSGPWTILVYCGCVLAMPIWLREPKESDKSKDDADLIETVGQETRSTDPN